MKSTIASFLKTTLYVCTISILITIPISITWAASLTEEEVNVWKMWIKLAWDGYAEPMPRNPTGEKQWWKYWD